MFHVHCTKCVWCMTAEDPLLQALVLDLLPQALMLDPLPQVLMEDLLPWVLTWHLQVLGAGLFHTLVPHLLVRSLVYGMLLACFQVHRHQVYLRTLPSSLTFPLMFLNGIVNWIIVQTSSRVKCKLDTTVPIAKWSTIMFASRVPSVDSPAPL